MKPWYGRGLAVVLMVGALAPGLMNSPAAARPDAVSAQPTAAPQADQAAKPMVATDKEGAVQLNKEGLKAYQAGNMEEAKDLFLKAVKADPGNAKFWTNLGLALRQLDRTREAVAAYSRANQAQPDYALPYKNLGVALEKLGDKDGAVEAYLKYFELAPEAPDAAAVKAWAENLIK
ncbi:MAG: tetratricopeptide repeat protein [Desulfobaccales bacterium]|nr:tetratricopeptide repeat protein [Desulfobaccales bacterium]